MSLNIEQLSAQWVLGQLHGAEIVDAATQGLIEGYDGPALRDLAGTVNPPLRDVADVFERALDELGALRPSRKEAALILAKGFAEQILSGLLSPYDGARAIWWDLSFELRPENHAVDPFIYWADEFESTRDLDRQRLCESAIYAAARELVGTSDQEQRKPEKGSPTKRSS